MKSSVLFGTLMLAALSAQAGLVSSSAPWKGEDEFSFAVSPQVGLMQGMSHEYVFVSIPSESYQGTLSRLDWKIKNVMVGGLEGGIRWGRLTLNGGVWTALNKGAGNMVDQDWIEIPELAESEGFSYSGTVSDSDLAEFYAFDLNVGYDLLRTEGGLWASVFGGIRRENWRWDAFGLEGTIGFPEYGYVEPQSEEPGEKVIAYRQEYLYGYLGARAGWAIGAFNMAAFVAWAPGFHAEDKDYHCLRDTTFRSDNDYGSHIMLYGVSVSADLTGSLSLTVAWEATHSGVARTTGTETGGEDEEEDDDDGDLEFSSWSGIKMRNSLFSASLGYVF